MSGDGEALAVAVAAEARGLVEGLRHAAVVVPEQAPVNHELQGPVRERPAALRAVDDDGEPLKQDKIEADFMQAAASLQNLLELVEVANSYIQLNEVQK